MTTRKIRTWWWVDFRWKGTRYRLKCPDNSQASARAYETALRQKLARGQDISTRHTPGAAMGGTLEEFSQEWLRIYVETNNRPATIRAKRSILRCHLLPVLGQLPLERITALEIERYKALKLKEGVPPKAINNHLIVLHKCLGSAVEWQLLAAVPRIRWLRVPPSKFDFLTFEEAERLLEAASREPFWFVLVLTALRTGLRIGELLALRWEDIDLENRFITVARSVLAGIVGPPKNNRIRRVPICRDLLPCLSNPEGRTGFLFPTASGSPIPYDSARRALQRLCRRAGLRRIGWHTLRHTFASHLVMNGGALPVVQDCLGHANIQMTRRYAHLTPEKLQDTVALLEVANTRDLATAMGTGWSRGVSAPRLRGVVTEGVSSLATTEKAPLVAACVV